MSNKSLSEELQWRGFVNQTTLKSVNVLDGGPLNFYWGVDPSAPSMTIGNLAAAMMVRHFISHGHKAVLLVGGATGMIGDPDGKKEERGLKPHEEVNRNKTAIAAQYQQLFGDLKFRLVDNYEWFKDISYLDFLRDIGKHVPMRQMLGRDFVQSRLSDEGAGISYAEFSYVLIQAYDFLHLNRVADVTLQVCGSDQWGNSIAGVDLIRRVTGNETHVWSAPLVINKATGVKFGKSEEGAIWLDPDMTSVYKFYQFWLNSDDAGVEGYLKIYTLLSEEEIEEIMLEFRKNPGGRSAQKKLAYEVTRLVHGPDRADTAVNVTKVVYRQGMLTELSPEEISVLVEELPFAKVKEGSTFADALVKTGLAGSKTDARRLIEQKAVSCNGSYDVDQPEAEISSKNSINNHIILFKGKHAALIEIG